MHPTPTMASMNVHKQNGVHFFYWLVDHLIVGNNVDEKISFKANPEEVQDAWWVSPADLQAILRNQPDALTPWFRLISQKLLFSEPYNLWNVFAKDSKINALGDKIIDLNEL